MQNIYSKLQLFNQTQCGGAMCFKDKHKPLAIRGHTLCKTMGGWWGQGLWTFQSTALGVSMHSCLNLSKRDRSRRYKGSAWQGDFDRLRNISDLFSLNIWAEFCISAKKAGKKQLRILKEKSRFLLLNWSDLVRKLGRRESVGMAAEGGKAGG